MDDLISRQAAIDWLVKRTHLTWECLKIIYPMLNMLEELPSAVRHGYIKNPMPYGECSECGFLIDIRDKFNYCPNCGALMVNEDDDTD